MDLLEPFGYGSAEPFQMKYMSGFSAEKYNMPSSELEPRAIGKAKKDAKVLMDNTLTRYTAIVERQDNVNFTTENDNYSLLPVWNYNCYISRKTVSFQNQRSDR